MDEMESGGHCTERAQHLRNINVACVIGPNGHEFNMRRHCSKDDLEITSRAAHERRYESNARSER